MTVSSILGRASLTAAGLLVATTPAWAGSTERISVGAHGRQGNGASTGGTFATGQATSADRRFVAFASDATNLVKGDTNGLRDVFVRDRHLGRTERVSVATGGAQAHGTSSSPTISADGLYVAFELDADDLVPGDTNKYPDIFLRDRATGETERVSVGPHGRQARFSCVDGCNGSFDPSISANGRFVAFSSDAINLVPGSLVGGCGEEFCSDNVFVRDRKKGRTELISVPYSGSNDLPSIGPVITPDGRFVAFISAASNLVQGDTSGGCRPEGAGCDWDVFVRDREHGTTERVSISTKGAQANASSFLSGISDDGRLVAFESDATNLVPGDSNGTTDVFVRDRKNGTTERVSVGPNGKQANAGSHGGFVSADGRYVVFSSDATNLVPGDTNGHADIFVRDLKLERIA